MRFANGCKWFVLATNAEEAKEIVLTSLEEMVQRNRDKLVEVVDVIPIQVDGVLLGSGVVM